MLTEYRTNKNSLTVTQKGNKAFRPITVKPGDHASIPEFLIRIYLEHFDEVEKINIKINDHKSLKNNTDYILYSLSVDVLFTDKALSLDWTRSAISAYDLVRAIHFFIFSGITCGLQDKITINNTKLNSLEDYIPFLMRKMPKSQYLLKDNQYLDAFFKFEKAGQKTKDLIMKNKLDQAEQNATSAYSILYVDAINMEDSFRSKTFKEMEESNKDPVLEISDKRAKPTLGFFESTLNKISNVLKLQTSLRLR